MVCRDGVHVYMRERATCDCLMQMSGPERAECREGMAVVYDEFGHYLGCIGRETWEKLLSGNGVVVPRETVERLISWLAPTRPQDEDGEAAWMASHLRSLLADARGHQDAQR